MSSRPTTKSGPELLNSLLADGQLANHLFRRAGSTFKKLITLSGCCPRCGASLAMEYASNPRLHHGKMLSLIITCADRCEKEDSVAADGPAEVNGGRTRWWLDEEDDSGDVEAIIRSLPRGEAELARSLNAETVRLNYAWLRTAGAAS